MGDIILCVLAACDCGTKTVFPARGGFAVNLNKFGKIGYLKASGCLMEDFEDKNKMIFITFYFITVFMPPTTGCKNEVNVDCNLKAYLSFLSFNVHFGMHLSNQYYSKI